MLGREVYLTMIIMLKVINYCFFILMLIFYSGCVKDNQINKLSEQNNQDSTEANRLTLEHSDQFRLRISKDKSVSCEISLNNKNETVIVYSFVEAIPSDKFGLVDLRGISGLTNNVLTEKLLTFDYDELSASFIPNVKQNTSINGPGHEVEVLCFCAARGEENASFCRLYQNNNMKWCDTSQMLCEYCSMVVIWNQSTIGEEHQFSGVIYN